MPGVKEIQLNYLTYKTGLILDDLHPLVLAKHVISRKSDRTTNSGEQYMIEHLHEQKNLSRSTLKTHANENNQFPLRFVHAAFMHNQMCMGFVTRKLA